MGIERFEDIVAWQGARTLAGEVYAVPADGKFARDYGLRAQVQRASVSIMCNIAEGFERGSNKEFRQFLYVAKASAGEVRSPLYLARDLEYVDQATYQRLTERATMISRQIGGCIKYLDAAPQSTRQSRT